MLSHRQVTYPQYFVKNLFKLPSDAVFIDGGAYIGDTIEDFIVFAKEWKKIIAWEPDAKNVVRLQKVCKGKKVQIINKGLWSGKATQKFNAVGTDRSIISEDGEVEIEVDSIDNLCSREKISMIKMDIEGAEQEAIRGAEKVIKRDKPVLAICIYHSYEDLWKIPQIIKEIEPSYKLYVRAHTDGVGELVVYGIAS